MHKFIVGFFMFIGLQGVCQEKQLLNKPYNEKYPLIGEFYSGILDLKDSLKIKNKVNEITTYARAHQDLELELEMELLWAYYLTKQKTTRDAGMHALRVLFHKSGEEGIAHIRIRALRVLAECYWNDFENFERAFEVYLQMEEALQEVTATAYPDKLMDLNRIALAYYYFQDYRPAIAILKEAVDIEETQFNSLHKANALNTLGLCYQKLEEFEASNRNFRALLELQIPETVEVWEPIAKGNLGYNHFLKKEFDAAEPMLLYDTQQAEQAEDYGLAAGALIPLAEIALLKNKLKDAEAYAYKARRYIALSGQTDRLRLLYPVLAKLTVKTRKMEQAMAYLDSAVWAQNNYHQKFSGLKLVRAEQKINRQENNLKLTAFNLERHQILQERNRILFFLAVVFVLVITVYLYFRDKHQKRMKVLQRAERNLQKAQQDLEAAGNQLKRYAQSSIQKNNYIKQLEQSTQQDDTRRVLNKLKETTILTDDDWNNFQSLFEKAHPGFIHQLKTHYHQLSQTEIRLLVLSRLLFTTKEMAAALGVSVNAIQVTRHRIRKKLGLEADVKLESLISSL